MISLKKFQPLLHIGLAVAVVFGLVQVWNYVSEHLLAPRSEEGMEDIIDIDVERDLPEAESVVPVEVKEPAGPSPSELGSGDLLPMSNLGSWTDTHPGGIGALENKNFLNSGHHVGINQIGQSLRNANYSIRSEPANPQKVVSPWINTTIIPDELRRPLEIGMQC